MQSQHGAFGAFFSLAGMSGMPAQCPAGMVIEACWAAALPGIPPSIPKGIRSTATIARKRMMRGWAMRRKWSPRELVAT